MNRTRWTRIAAVSALVVSSALMFPVSATADVAVNMNLVCQQNLGNTSWAAKLVNANSVYGWKCWNRAYPEQFVFGPFFDADVNYYCRVVEGSNAYFTNVSDPYSWRCR